MPALVPSVEIRPAAPEDAASIRDLTRAAYAKWAALIGREPLPMQADYDRAVRERDRPRRLGEIDQDEAPPPAGVAPGAAPGLKDAGSILFLLLADARRTGATVIASDADPLAGLIGAQRLAAVLAERKGIDPDQPRALSRSVILT